MFGVLVVDDNKIFRELLRDLLLLNYPSVEVYEASNGEEAIQKVESHFPGLILMDIHLGGGENGLKIAEKIRQAGHSDVKIAILTSFDLPEYKEAAMEYGFEYFFIKGLSTLEDIRTLVGSVLAEREVTHSLPC